MGSNVRGIDMSDYAPFLILFCFVSNLILILTVFQIALKWDRHRGEEIHRLRDEIRGKR